MKTTELSFLVEKCLLMNLVFLTDCNTILLGNTTAVICKVILANASGKQKFI